MDPLLWFFMSLVFFHTSEFALNAFYHPNNIERGSWLLSQPYIIAMCIAVVEYTWRVYVFPFALPVPSVVGLGMILLGEGIRKLAIVQCGVGFTHKIRFQKKEGHVLVTDGIYRYIRHPGYLGFIVWSAGTQVLLGNVLSLIGFLIVGWRFMKQRIHVEDDLLQAFFGSRWVEWQHRTPSGIPGIR